MTDEIVHLSENGQREWKLTRCLECGSENIEPFTSAEDGSIWIKCNDCDVLIGSRQYEVNHYDG